MIKFSVVRVGMVKIIHPKYPDERKTKMYIDYRPLPEAVLLTMGLFGLIAFESNFPSDNTKE